MKKIRVLVANDIVNNRGAYTKIFAPCEDIEVVGEVTNSEELLKKTRQLIPDVIIIDLNLSVVNSISAAEKIILNFPESTVIIVSPNGDPEYLKKAMNVGARDYLIKPFDDEDLILSVREAYRASRQYTKSLETLKKGIQERQSPQIVTVFGTKGGVGKTTIAVNLAVQLAKSTLKKVVLVDLDLQFGDVPIFLNIIPKRTIAELVQEKNKLDAEVVNSYLVPHMSGIKVLAAPSRPEYSELIEPEYISELLTVLREQYDYVVIDTPPFFNEAVLSALDMSNQIIMVMSMDMPSIKNAKLSLEILESMRHKGKIKLVLNRASEEFGIEPKDVETSLDFLVSCQVPSDGRLVVKSVNRGTPFVLSNSNAKISECISSIAKLVAEDSGYQKDLQLASSKKPFVKRLFGKYR